MRARPALALYFLHMRTFIVAFAGGIIGSVFVSYAVIAWTGPTSAPPSNNVAPPINVGTIDQVKDGGLALNSLAVFGRTSALGDILFASGASQYVNFGVNLANETTIASTSGASGYGIRDNAGTMQFRNAGGQWTSIPSASSGFANMQVFTSSGTFVVPAGVSRAKVTVVGGGGGSCRTTDGTRVCAAGGGGGTAIEIITGLVPGTSITVTVGAGAAPKSNGDGNPGGTSSFGSYLSATGGQGGTRGSDGFVPVPAVGGAGGIGSGGQLNVAGSAGVAGGPGGSSHYGGGGGYLSPGRSYGGGAGAGDHDLEETSAGAPGVVIVEY